MMNRITLGYVANYMEKQASVGGLVKKLALLGALGGAGYGGYKWLEKNKEKLDPRLMKLLEETKGVFNDTVGWGKNVGQYAWDTMPWGAFNDAVGWGKNVGQYAWDKNPWK